MRGKSYFYGFVIQRRTKEKRPFIGGRTYYFAERVGIKNPRVASNIHYHVKIFGTKAEAEEYFFKKLRACPQIDWSAYDVKRRKFFLEKGKWDYWKNREVLHR